MCRLLETLRVEGGVAQWVDYHQRRVDRSIGGAAGVDLRGYVDRIELPPSGCHKLRIVYCEGGIVGHTISPYFERSIRRLRLVVADHLIYDRKAEDRSAIDRLVELREGADDVIIVRNGAVTDSSFANLAFFDGRSWVTPDLPLLEGTCRARLIDSGILTKKHIVINALPSFHRVMLVNSMKDFDPARALPISAIER